MSTYKRVSGIRPSPLQNLHLQPSEPPPSATEDQLVLFERVLGRRTAQLQDLPFASLSTVYLLLSAPGNPTAEEIRVLLKELPNKEPTTENQYISIILYLLIGNFHKSIDTREQRDCRQGSLKKVHHILECCDIAYTDHTELAKEERLKEQQIAEEKKQRELEETAKKKAEEFKKRKEHLRNLYHQKDPLKENPIPKDPKKTQQQKETTELVTKAAKEENLTMGAILSSQQQSIGGKAVDDAIIILDSDDEAEAPSGVDKQPAIASTPSISSRNQEGARSATKSSMGSLHDNQNQSKDLAATSSLLKPTKCAKEGNDEYEKHLASATSKKNSIVSVSATKIAKFPLIPNSSRLPTTKRTISFQPDTKNGATTFSSSIVEEKNPRNLSFDQGHSRDPNHCSFIDGEILNDVHDRYSRWEPYWEVSHDLSLLNIQGVNVGYKTSAIVNPNTYSDCPPLSALEIQFQTGNLVTLLKEGSFKKEPKEHRLILRALPLVVPEKYKKARSDTPLWPKGTFIQHNGIPIAIHQRKQQGHDNNLWKGMSHMLDLTGLAIRAPSRSMTQRLEICTKEGEAYNFQLAICSYVPPQVLFERCVGDGPNSLTKLSIEEGRSLVKHNLDGKDAVVIDDSDGEDDTGLDSDIHLTYSLLCGASMSAIKTPVRGKKCKHMQCFDLANYLHSNNHVSGGRWRCLVCEDFVPVQDLMIDGFVAKILEEHGDRVSSSRDKVEIYRNGTWKFLSENRLKYQKKRSNTSSSEQPDGKRAKLQNSGPAEVIDILDD